MKQYHLKVSDTIKMQYSVWNARNNNRKALDVFTGLVLGVVADGEINSQEASFLANWIESNETELPVKLILNLSPYLERLKSSSTIDEKELHDFLDLILTYAGLTADEVNNLNSSVKSSIDLRVGKPVDWYFDQTIDSITFTDSEEFALSGNFLSGEKSKIRDAIIKRGAKIAPKQPRASTTFLVVGEKGSDQWKHSNLGNSIKKAIDMQETGLNIIILKESLFLKFLEE